MFLLYFILYLMSCNITDKSPSPPWGKGLGAIVGGEHSPHGSGAYDTDKCDL